MLYRGTGWESLEKRRHKLCLFFQMNTGVSPNYISSLIPASVEDSTTYNLRNANNFRHTLSRTQQYYRSFLPSNISAWNDLSLEVRQSNSIQSFTYQLNKNLKKPPKHYYIGNRIFQIQHTRLRTDCSSPNHHLFFKKILLTVLTVPVVQLKLQNITFSNAKGITRSGH